MEVPRRHFNGNLKLAAFRGIEQGAPTELARRMDVNAKVLHRRRREFRRTHGDGLSGLPSWNVRSASELLRLLCNPADTLWPRLTPLAGTGWASGSGYKPCTRT